MPKMMLIHAMPEPIPVSQAEQVAKLAKAFSTTDAYWVSSWNKLNDKGNIAMIICEWDAKDAESIKKILEQMGAQIPNFPCDGPYSMSKTDGESYR